MDFLIENHTVIFSILFAFAVGVRFGMTSYESTLINVINESNASLIIEEEQTWETLLHTMQNTLLPYQVFLGGFLLILGSYLIYNQLNALYIMYRNRNLTFVNAKDDYILNTNNNELTNFSENTNNNALRNLSENISESVQLDTTFFDIFSEIDFFIIYFI